LAAGIAHELGTPLNVVSGRAKLIRDGELDDAEVRDSARVIEEQARRMANIIRQLLDFARVDTRKTERGDLRSVAQESCALLRPMADKKHVNLEFVPPPQPICAVFSFSHVLQAVMNLVVNAVQAAPERSAVVLSTRLAVARPPSELGGPPLEWAVLSVRDQGGGMVPEISSRVFEPFFTTKGVGEGTGLGLSVAYGIAQDHGGFIELATIPEHGSTFSLYLPTAWQRSLTPEAA
jgi:signal transduction histidine kinase